MCYHFRKQKERTRSNFSRFTNPYLSWLLCLPLTKFWSWRLRKIAQPINKDTCCCRTKIPWNKWFFLLLTFKLRFIHWWMRARDRLSDIKIDVSLLNLNVKKKHLKPFTPGASHLCHYRAHQNVIRHQTLTWSTTLQPCWPIKSTATNMQCLYKWCGI